MASVFELSKKFNREFDDKTLAIKASVTPEY